MHTVKLIIKYCIGKTLYTLFKRWTLDYANKIYSQLHCWNRKAQICKSLLLCIPQPLLHMHPGATLVHSSCLEDQRRGWARWKHEKKGRSDSYLANCVSFSQPRVIEYTKQSQKFKGILRVIWVVTEMLDYGYMCSFGNTLGPEFVNTYLDAWQYWFVNIRLTLWFGRGRHRSLAIAKAWDTLS